ncbi:MAG: GGDEF domain-containing protein [Myxococcota bacterium]
MKLLGYFILLSGMGIVTLSLGWIAGYHGLGTIIPISLVPLVLAALLALSINYLQQNSPEVKKLKHSLSLRTAQLQDSNQIIKRISTRDRLTGLYNKKGFTHLLKREMKRCARLETSLVVMAVNFKSLGKDSGKRYSMMSILGRRISNFIRDTDVFARISEDTLAFLLLDTDKEGAQTFINRLNQRLNQSSFKFPPFKMGISVFPQHEQDKPEPLIASAIKASKLANEGEIKEAEVENPQSGA